MSTRRTPTRYAELVCRTNFSFLRGASAPGELVEAAAGLGLHALAITDRHTLAGVVRAHEAAREHSVKLLIGAEILPVDGPPITLYAMNRAGYGRLSRLLTIGKLRAPKGECELAVADVVAHAEDLVCVVLEKKGVREIGSEGVREEKRGDDNCAETVCSRQRDSAGETCEDTPYREGDAARAQARGSLGISDCAWRAGAEQKKGNNAPLRSSLTPLLPHSLTPFREAFADRLYLAVSSHAGGADRERVAARAALSRATGIPLVAVNDVHYHSRDRRFLQDVLVCIREHCTIAEAGGRLFPNGERHLKGAEEMARIFYDYPAVVARSVEIADRCTFSLDELRYEYPEELSPPGVGTFDYLTQLTWQGARQHYPGGVPDRVRKTIEHELDLIRELQYEPYFLTVWDLVRFARSRGILCQGRGSAANSAVCYCLGVTSVDPDRIDLLFERFVSRERNEPPDIDIDFEHERREEVFQYIYQKYGRDRAGIVAEVISYRPRSAVRDVGKALGLSLDRVDLLAKKLEWWGDKPLPDETLREAGLNPEEYTVRCLRELVSQIQGFPRHLSQHVGGFVMTRGPLHEMVPIGNTAMPDRTFIEWDKDDIDVLGILKVDCLALGMLTALQKCFNLLKKGVRESGWKKGVRELGSEGVREEKREAMMQRGTPGTTSGDMPSCVADLSAAHVKPIDSHKNPDFFPLTPSLPHSLTPSGRRGIRESGNEGVRESKREAGTQRGTPRAHLGVTPSSSFSSSSLTPSLPHSLTPSTQQPLCTSNVQNQVGPTENTDAKERDVSRSDRLAEGDGDDQGSLCVDRRLAGGGEIWAQTPATEGGRLGSEQYRGGECADDAERLSAVPCHGPRLARGVGDAGTDCGGSRDAKAHRPSPGGDQRRAKASSGVDPIAGGEARAGRQTLRKKGARESGSEGVREEKKGESFIALSLPIPSVTPKLLPYGRGTDWRDTAETGTTTQDDTSALSSLASSGQKGMGESGSEGVREEKRKSEDAVAHSFSDPAVTPEPLPYGRGSDCAVELGRREVSALPSSSSLTPLLPYSLTPFRRPSGLTDIPAEDPAVYDMICRADTVGVFQIESRAQMSMLPRLKPRNFYDLVIEVAIVRPGPIQGGMVHPYLRRRNGQEAVVFPNDAIKEVLKKTMGVPLFQEQAMRLAVVAAGFTPGEADQLRRAMAAWRRSGSIEKFRIKLLEGMKANGLPEQFAEQVFEQIRGFGDYGFPESHAASFALLVYASAWLKLYYPAVFCAAILNSQPMGFYAPAQLVRDAREHGVEVLPIDVNASEYDCLLEEGSEGVRESGSKGREEGERNRERGSLSEPRPSARAETTASPWRKGWKKGVRESGWKKGVRESGSEGVREEKSGGEACSGFFSNVPSHSYSTEKKNSTKGNNVPLCSSLTPLLPYSLTPSLPSARRE